MISLNPSGFACSFDEQNLENLTRDKGGKKNFSANRSRRGRFYNVVTCLHINNPISTFWTFTIQKLQTDYPVTDQYYSGQFQRLLEGLRLRYDRGVANGLRDYVWVSEAQERGNIHFHLITSTPFIEISFVQDYWNRLINQDSKNSVDVLANPCKKIKNISGYFAKDMSKAHSKGFNGKGLKARIIYARSFGYSRNFPIFDRILVHPLRLQRDFPDMEEKKVTKEIFIGDGESIKIDYYYLDSEKVLKFIQKEYSTIGFI